MKTKKYFNSIRWLAIAALICTAIIIAVMIIESSMPGDKSLTQSGKWTDSLQEYAGDRFENTFVGTEPVRRIFANSMRGFTGDREKASFTCVPTDCRPTEFAYKIDDTSVAEVDEQGYVTFKKVGHTMITVSVKDDPSIYGVEYIYNYGTNPDNITYAEPKFTTVKLCQIIPNFRLIDQDGNEVDTDAFDITQENNCVRFSTIWLTGMEVGKCNVTFSPKGHPERQFTYTFETFPDPNVVRAEGVILKTNEITVNKYEQFDIRDYIEKMLPENTNHYSFVGAIHNPNGKTVLSSVSGEIKLASNEGTATITIMDNVSNLAKADLTVHVVVPTPTVLQVTGERQAQLNLSYFYTAEGDYCSIENVTWSIVSGKAQISQDGKLTKTHLGTVVIRATSNDDPSVYGEISVEVKLFTSFGSFIRKAIGHFALFIVIGFGLAASFAFLIKPRLASVPVSVVSGFAFALLSETLQLPIFTNGRMFAWSDVIVDFFGAIVGMAAAYLVFVIVLLCFRLNKHRKELMTAFNNVYAKTMFKKAPPFEIASAAPDDSAQAQACADIDDPSPLSSTELSADQVSADPSDDNRS